MNPHARHARTAHLWVGLIVPLAILVVTGAVIASWLPQLPDPAATHWGGDGRPDGFGPAWVNLAVPVGLGSAIVLLFAALSWASMRMPQHEPGPAALGARSQDLSEAPSFTARFLAAVSLGLSVMMSVVALAMTGSQRGLADAKDAPDIGWALLVGFVVLAAGAVLGWFVQPTPPAHELSDAPGAEPMPLAEGGRAAWFGAVTLSRSGRVALAGLLLFTFALGIVLLANGAGAGWILTGVALLLTLAVLATSVFRVRADASGLHVRSALGWPRYAVPADEISSVRAVVVNPFAEFGGWGIRWGVDGRFGIVLRTGEGIEVSRENAKTMVVTVDDAATCAAVLSAAAAQGKDSA